MSSRTAGTSLLLIAVIVLGGCGRSTGQRSTGVPPAATGPAPTATSRPLPSRTYESSPLPGPSPSSAVGLVVDGTGSDLTTPMSPTVRHAQPAKYTAQEGCYGIGYDPGFAGNCQLLTSPLGTAIADIETRGTEERTLIWTLSGQQADLALRRVRTLPVPAGSVNAQDGGAQETELAVSDLNNDRTPALIIEAPAAAGARPPLATLDVVQTSGIVGLHRNLHGGEARKAPGGGLETWTPLGTGQVEHTTFQYQSGAWRVVDDGITDRNRVPSNTGSF